MPDFAAIGVWPLIIRESGTLSGWLVPAFAQAP
jgi:hypothetical protein